MNAAIYIPAINNSFALTVTSQKVIVTQPEHLNT